MKRASVGIIEDYGWNLGGEFAKGWFWGGKERVLGRGWNRYIDEWVSLLCFAFARLRLRFWSTLGWDMSGMDGCGVRE